MDIQDRIVQIIEHFGLNKNSFSIRVGIQPQTLHHIISGRRTKPSYEVLEKICLAFPELNTSWLIAGKGDMIETDVYTQMCTKDVGEVSGADISHHFDETQKGRDINTDSQEGAYSYISEEIKTKLKILENKFEEDNATMLYLLSNNELSRKIIKQRTKLKNLYNDYSLLISTMKSFDLDFDKKRIPPTWEVEVELFESDFKSRTEKIKDKKLKAVLLLLLIGERVDIMMFIISTAIKSFNSAVKYASFTEDVIKLNKSDINFSKTPF